MGTKFFEIICEKCEKVMIIEAEDLREAEEKSEYRCDCYKDDNSRFINGILKSE